VEQGIGQVKPKDDGQATAEIKFKIHGSGTTKRLAEKYILIVTESQIRRNA